MFATKKLAQNLSQQDVGETPNDSDYKHDHIGYLRHLQQQSKQISQIIAYIWRWCDDQNKETNCEEYETAKQLKSYFEIPSEKVNDVDGNLKKLFRANPCDPEDQSKEANLLRHVFRDVVDNENPNYIFPIFSAAELGDENPEYGYLFNISVNAFTGSIEDAEINEPALLRMTIPYPPRPVFSNATLEKKTLENWIKDRNKNKFFADNHYIPTSCS